VDLAGFEPATSSVRLKRAPNCATGPRWGGEIVSHAEEECQGDSLSGHPEIVKFVTSGVYVEDCTPIHAGRGMICAMDTCRRQFNDARLEKVGATMRRGLKPWLLLIMLLAVFMLVGCVSSGGGGTPVPVHRVTPGFDDNGTTAPLPFPPEIKETMTARAQSGFVASTPAP
jgi:hypothetical protein